MYGHFLELHISESQHLLSISEYDFELFFQGMCQMYTLITIIHSTFSVIRVHHYISTIFLKSPLACYVSTDLLSHFT